MPPPRDPGSCAGSACGARSKAGFFAKGACPQPAREACEGKSACAGFAQEGRALHRSFPFRGFGTLPNKQFSTDAPQRGRGKYGSGYPLPMLATNVFIPYALLRSYARFCQTSAKEKRCNPQKKITTLSKPYSILTDTSYLPSVSTSAISFAVALTIRMPVSLIPSRSASSCRRCVFFSGGVSKRNWSTDIL